MPFANGAKAQDESAAVFRRARLVGMTNNAWIEQGRGFERIFVEKIGPDQSTLRLAQWSMGVERLLHFRCARLENIEQVPVPALEVLKHLSQLLCARFGIEPKHPGNNMIGANLVGRVEVSGLSRRLEGPYDDPRRVRAQIEALAVHEFGGGQRCSLMAIGLIPHRRRWRIIFLTQVSRGLRSSWL